MNVIEGILASNGNWKKYYFRIIQPDDFADYDSYICMCSAEEKGWSKGIETRFYARKAGNYNIESNLFPKLRFFLKHFK